MQHKFARLDKKTWNKLYVKTVDQTIKLGAKHMLPAIILLQIFASSDEQTPADYFSKQLRTQKTEGKILVLL